MPEVSSGKNPTASIFLRLYGGILVCILLISAATWWGLQEINEWRAQRYREGVATGVFRLIALGVQRHQGLELRPWMDEVGKLMETPLELVGGAPQHFTSREYRHLAHGQTVLRLNGEETAADIFVKVPGHRDMYVHARMVRVSEQQGKAMALLFLDTLGSTPPDKQQQMLDDLRRYFSFAISIVPETNMHLDLEQKRRIKQKEVLLLLKQGNTPNSSSLRILAPIPNDSSRVLVMGPLYLFIWMPARLMVIASLIALLAITLCAYLLVRPLEQRLRRLEMAVRRLRAGDLAARADVDSRDEIGQLAKVFNGMAEHIQRLLGSQREMVRAVSHELRTPVARIRFGVEMLADTDLQTDREQQLIAIDADIEELNQLIDEILTYAKLEEGNPRLRISIFSLPALLERVRTETNALRTSVHVDVESSRMDEVAGEERYIHRIVQNLVGNAIRYAENRVILSCGQNAHANWLSVEDDGPGIPDSQRERVFEPFARLDDSRTRASGGYGLGLSIVQKIVHWHEGNVVVTTSPALGGACFTMTWPRRLSTSLQPSKLLTDNMDVTKTEQN
ncbi:MAG: HAMP domain-containing protein [Pseudomonadales bacterium]|nr:HAMP domain-containing protein [Pseudomonadales bacterium]